MINNALSALKQVTNPLGNPVIGESLASDGKVASRDLADVRSLTGQSVTQAPPLTIPAWQVAALNQRAERRRSTPLQTFINGANEGNPVAVTLAGEEIRKQYDPMRDGFANQIQNPDFSRIDASRENLDQIRAGAPGIPSQAELQRPSENQMIAAGLAALVNPRQAFQSLSVPLNYGVYEQGQRQGLLNQENALEQQRYQEALRQANAELGLEGDAFTANQRAAEGAFGSIANLDRQAMADANDLQNTMYTQDRLDYRADLSSQTQLAKQQMKMQGDMILEQERQSGRMDIATFNDPLQRSMRLRQVLEPAVQAGRLTAEQADAMAYAQQFTPYYGNQNTLARTENTQANTAYTEARTETLRAMLQFVPQIEQAKLEKLYADTERILTSGANDPESRTTLADAYRVHGDIAGQAEKQRDALKKQREELLKKLDQPSISGTAISWSERAAINNQIASMDIAITQADSAVRAARAVANEAGSRLANRGTSGGVTSGGSFRPAAVSGTGGGIQWPTDTRRITSGFGSRNAPTRGASSYHQGIDIGVPIGTSVRSIAEGTVVFSGTMRGYGNTMVVQHSDGTFSLYGHLSTLAAKKGEVVAAGDYIAQSGNTGTSTGAHLHLGMWSGTFRDANDLKRENAIDPRTRLPRN